jgi:hypothetical protein
LQKKEVLHHATETANSQETPLCAHKQTGNAKRESLQRQETRLTKLCVVEIRGKMTPIRTVNDKEKITNNLNGDDLCYFA